MFEEKLKRVVVEEEKSGLEDIIADINMLMKDWKNEIPDEVFDTNNPELKDIKFKARKTWFTMVNLLLSEIVEGKTERLREVSAKIDPALIERTEEYLKERATRITSQELTKPEDIEVADDLLSHLYDELTLVRSN